MKTTARIGVLGAVAGLLAALGGYSAHAANNLCVGNKPGCFTTIQAAVNAASDGDTITIAPGTFAGGVTIDVSVKLLGAGSNKTIIQGGGPVLTIGQDMAATEPTVSISRVTITGGSNNSSPDRAVTQGGGVQIPQGSFESRDGVGATVTITDSVVTGNKVASQELLPPGFCGPFDCSFASGGGVWSAGILTLINTRVSDNQAGDPGSATVTASAGGIENAGTLTLKHSFVTGNRATATLPWGGQANGGGIDAPGRLTIEDSVVSGNSAELSTSDPSDQGPIAFAGGIGIGAQATITHTIVSGNSVTADNVGSDALGLAFAGGILDEGALVLSASTVSRNHVSSSIAASAQGSAFGGAGGMEVHGAATIRDSGFVANGVTASAPAGFVGAVGGGISNFGQTTLERTVVTANLLTAKGSGGFANGGGILNDSFFGGPPPNLTLNDSAVTGNRLNPSPGITLQGGGLFTTIPLMLTRTLIAGNKPDQCFGC